MTMDTKDVAAWTVTTTAPVAVAPGFTPTIFSEDALRRHVAAIFEGVPVHHQWATVGYAALEGGQYVTKFALARRSVDGSWLVAAELQQGSSSGIAAGVFVKKSW